MEKPLTNEQIRMPEYAHRHKHIHMYKDTREGGGGECYRHVTCKTYLTYNCRIGKLSIMYDIKTNACAVILCIKYE